MPKQATISTAAAAMPDSSPYRVALLPVEVEKAIVRSSTKSCDVVRNYLAQGKDINAVSQDTRQSLLEIAAGEFAVDVIDLLFKSEGREKQATIPLIRKKYAVQDMMKDYFINLGRWDGKQQLVIKQYYEQTVNLLLNNILDHKVNADDKQAVLEATSFSPEEKQDLASPDGYAVLFEDLRRECIFRLCLLGYPVNAIERLLKPDIHLTYLVMAAVSVSALTTANVTAICKEVENGLQRFLAKASDKEQQLAFARQQWEKEQKNIAAARGVAWQRFIEGIRHHSPAASPDMISRAISVLEGIIKPQLSQKLCTLDKVEAIKEQFLQALLPLDTLPNLLGQVLFITAIHNNWIDVVAFIAQRRIDDYFYFYDGKNVVSSMLVAGTPDSRNSIEFFLTPLMVAAARGHLEIVQLLSSRSGVNAQSTHGRTALMEAAKKGHAAVVKFLLEHGANPRVTDYREQKSAYQMARDAKHSTTAEQLCAAELKQCVPNAAPAQLTQLPRLAHCLAEAKVDFDRGVIAIDTKHLSTVRDEEKRSIPRVFLGAAHVTALLAEMPHLKTDADLAKRVWEIALAEYRAYHANDPLVVEQQTRDLQEKIQAHVAQAKEAEADIDHALTQIGEKTLHSVPEKQKVTLEKQRERRVMLMKEITAFAAKSQQPQTNAVATRSHLQTLEAQLNAHSAALLGLSKTIARTAENIQTLRSRGPTTNAVHTEAIRAALRANKEQTPEVVPPLSAAAQATATSAPPAARPARPAKTARTKAAPSPSSHNTETVYTRFEPSRRAPIPLSPNMAMWLIAEQRKLEQQSPLNAEEMRAQVRRVEGLNDDLSMAERALEFPFNQNDPDEMMFENLVLRGTCARALGRSSDNEDDWNRRTNLFHCHAIHYQTDNAELRTIAQSLVSNERKLSDSKLWQEISTHKISESSPSVCQAQLLQGLAEIHCLRRLRKRSSTLYQGELMSAAVGFVAARLSTYVTELLATTEQGRLLKQTEDGKEIEGLIAFAKQYQESGGDYRHGKPLGRLRSSAESMLLDQQPPADRIDRATAAVTATSLTAVLTSSTTAASTVSTSSASAIHAAGSTCAAAVSSAPRSALGSS
jgi:ankyrin repeat protein